MALIKHLAKNRKTSLR